MGGIGGPDALHQHAIEGRADFGPSAADGRNLHFGVREHAMAAAANGHGPRTAGSGPTAGRSWSSRITCAPAIRLAAMMGLPVVYVFTHDSIGWARTGPPTSRWSTWPPCGRSPADGDPARGRRRDGGGLARGASSGKAPRPHADPPGPAGRGPRRWRPPPGCPTVATSCRLRPGSPARDPDRDGLGSPSGAGSVEAARREGGRGPRG